jgi:hypothetical protein
LWKADTTRASGPSNRCAICAADPSAGSCATDTLGGTSGTTASTTILPATADLISFRIASWLEYGIARRTTSAAFAAAKLSSPVTAAAAPADCSSRAAACALSFARDPSTIG